MSATTTSNLFALTVQPGDTLVQTNDGRRRLLDVERIKHGIVQLQYRGGRLIREREDIVNRKLANGDYCVFIGQTL